MASMVPLVMRCVVCQETATCKVLNDRGMLAGYFCEQHGFERLELLNRREQAERDARKIRQETEERVLRSKMKRMNGNSTNGRAHATATYITLSPEDVAAVEACLS